MRHIIDRRIDSMKELLEMSREELFEVVRIKDALIKELRGEIGIYQELVRELQTSKDSQSK
jgi:hypothetical protein